MNHQKRPYNRRVDQGDKSPIIDDRPEEIVTGIPATAENPPGSTQFDAFKTAEQEAAEYNRLGQNADLIEDRDNRGADQIDGKGATKARIPMHEVDRLAAESAAVYSRDVKRVRSQADGNTLSVTIETKHGTQRASAKVDAWTTAGVNKALDEIEEKISGERADGTAPKDKLAEAVRDIAAGKDA